MEQQLSLLVESLSTPKQGTEKNPKTKQTNKKTDRSGSHFTLSQTSNTSEDRYGQQGGGGQGWTQAILHKSCLRRSTDMSPLYTGKKGVGRRKKNMSKISKKKKIYGTAHRVTHTSKQNLWNKNTCTGMQKQNKTKKTKHGRVPPPTHTQTSFHLTDFIQLAFSLEWQYRRTRLYTVQKPYEKQIRTEQYMRIIQQNALVTTKHWYSTEGRGHLPLFRNPTIQDASQGN